MREEITARNEANRMDPAAQVFTPKVSEPIPIAAEINLLSEWGSSCEALKTKLQEVKTSFGDKFQSIDAQFNDIDSIENSIMS